VVATVIACRQPFSMNVVVADHEYVAGLRLTQGIGVVGGRRRTGQQRGAGDGS
jgi:hypothetical protein